VDVTWWGRVRVGVKTLPLERYFLSLELVAGNDMSSSD
jgi:hypothetical protein